LPFHSGASIPASSMISTVIRRMKSIELYMWMMRANSSKSSSVSRGQSIVFSVAWTISRRCAVRSVSLAMGKAMLSSRSPLVVHGKSLTVSDLVETCPVIPCPEVALLRLLGPARCPVCAKRAALTVGLQRCRTTALRHIAHRPLCTVSDKIKPGMRDCKYPRRSPSRGPRARSPSPKDPADYLAEGPPSFDGPRQRSHRVTIASGRAHHVHHQRRDQAVVR
jgi:hypothetical protein